MHRHIFHGTSQIFEVPVFGAGNYRNDYGLGFYCTKDPALASEWAVSKERDGWVNSYVLELNGLRILNLHDRKFNVMHWLAILLENRRFHIDFTLGRRARDYILENFHTDYRSHDVIIGYRADDSYFSYAEAFIGGMISYSQLRRAMRLVNLGDQIVLVSQQAFGQVQFNGRRPCLRSEWLSPRENRETTARRRFQSMMAEPFSADDLYIREIILEGISDNDPRLS